jgi:hypothetical protein
LFFPWKLSAAAAGKRGIFLAICHEVVIRSIRRNLLCILEVHSFAVIHSQQKKSYSLLNPFPSQLPLPPGWLIKVVDAIHVNII